jgi:cellulose synthase/poly-beta-1,6-N-acetylglucosamine synthase-like glycosyltransferase/peptidoglycan/xylan/chitin deacetylase (PgdA/CDA1 family)/spore germination protein YaaH
MTNLQSPVFYAPNGKRWKRTRIFALSLSGFIVVLTGIFFFSLYVTPFLPSFSIRAKPIVSQNNSSQSSENADSSEMPTRFESNPATTNENRPTTVGFYVNWDDTSYASLKRNIDKIDWFSPEWIRLQDGEDPLVLDFDAKALDLIHKEKPGMPILPLVQNYKNEIWNPQILARAVATESSRRKLIDALTKTVEDNKFAGLTIDLEEVPPKSQNNLFDFMKALYETFHARGLLVAQTVPFDNPDWNYKAYADFSDYLMLMAYDEHWESGQAGAISSQNWFEQILAKRMKELDPQKTIVCIGNYGYDWSNKEKEATESSFQESVLSARDSEAKINFDPVSQNPYFSYDEDDGSHHTVWFLDAVTAFNQIQASEKFKPFGFALWRLGSEDPSLWEVFGGDSTTNPNIENLKTIRYGYDIDFEGIGEILQVIAEPQDGSRIFKFNERGAIARETYTATPSSYVIQRTGDHPGLVALTFDDGPDPDWTPKILDELKRENVPATFFVVGSYGQENPGLIKRIVTDGHDIGNHSFTHPNLGEIPNGVTTVEINATQRLIQSLTGRSTTLFRAPYFGDAEPQTPDEVEPIVEAKRLGYITVGLHVDPDDWQTPGTDEIVKRTVDGVTNQTTDEDVRGQVVLLHDGGGDRSETLAALPRIIETLRAKGYRFVTVSQLAGLPQEKTMPFVAQDEQMMTRADNVAFSMFWFFNKTMKWLFWLGIILGTARLLFIVLLVLRKRFRKTKTVSDASFQPFVSVIVPAFNEEKVIVKTLKSLLNSNYPNFEILVVDDGSTDDTSRIVAEKFGGEPKVQLFTLANGGKANALNYGLKHAKGEIIIGLDADTIFAPQTICELAREFADKEVGAAAGNAKVGNRLNMITRWQALEYITSQNLDRRAFASLNAITVVPGAVGAWRREALERAQGFESNTLAEDQDLTLRVRQLGYRIAYAERAVAYTEAPDSFCGLAKQRFRWSFGTLQCMWKHRRALFNKRFGALGWVAMPNVWIFQILFPLVSPLMDLMFVWTMTAYLIQRLEHPKEFIAPHVAEVVFYYAFFLIVDLLAAAVGFAFERKENWRLLAWLPIQRFGYRQVMYSVMVKSVKTAFKGGLVGWNKVERKATVAEMS